MRAHVRAHACVQISVRRVCALGACVCEYVCVCVCVSASVCMCVVFSVFVCVFCVCVLVLVGGRDAGGRRARSRLGGQAGQPVGR